MFCIGIQQNIKIRKLCVVEDIYAGLNKSVWQPVYAKVSTFCSYIMNIILQAVKFRDVI